MPEKGSLTEREYIGTVLPDKDSNNRGWYKVNIPNLQPHMKDKEGIFCQNHVIKNRVSPSADGVCGSYYPLHAGMSVIVKFFENDLASGYIDRVISDAYTNSLPLEIIERDDYYQIIRTPKHSNIIAIYEGDVASTNVPKNSIHVYFNATRTTVVIDENGINISSLDNQNVTVGKNCNITVTGDVNLKATGAMNLETSATMSLKASTIILDSANLSITGKVKSNDIHTCVNGDTAVHAVAGPFSATSATSADPPSLITISDYKYFNRSSGS